MVVSIKKTVVEVVVRMVTVDEEDAAKAEVDEGE